jgi:hypothetical protein
VEAATVLLFQSFDRQRVGNRFWIKSLPLVRDDNGHSFSQLTLTTDLNQLVSVHPIAVNDCVAQSFLKRQFHGGLIADNAARTLDQSHQAVHQRRDSSDFTRHPSLDFEQGTTRADAGERWSQRRFPIHAVRSVHGKASRLAPRQPKPVAHGIKQSKSLAMAQDAIPLVPLTSENQHHRHCSSPVRFVRATLEKATRMPKLNMFRQQRMSLICFEIAAKREIEEG